MALLSIFHVNVNCRNFDTSLAFYQSLGFTIELPFPEDGSPLVAEGLGVGEHRVKGALLKLGDGPLAARLDLLEWLSPQTETPQHSLTDPGIVRIAFASSSFEEDVRRLRENGVKFISDIIYRTTPEGPRPMFVCFYDPDGNVLELVNGEQRPGAAKPATS